MQKKVTLGIDVSKGYADFVLLNDSKEELGTSFKLFDNRAGHDLLASYIDRQKEDLGFEHMYCIVESTGGYENNWFGMLSKQQDHVLVSRVNPRATKAQRDSSLKRTVTDKVSARTIAEYGVDKRQELYTSNPDSVQNAQARKYYCYIQTMVKGAGICKQQLEKHIYEAFPELLTYCKRGMPKWVPRLLQHYPCASSIVRLKPSTLAKKIRGITPLKAEKLIAKAKQTVAQPTHALLQRTIKQLSKDICGRTIKIEQEKAFLEANFSHPWIELLSSIKGVGVFTSIASTLEIEDVERFINSAAISCYFGVHPVFKESGDGNIVARMSKQGRPRFRAVLYMAAKNVAIHNPYFKDIYLKLRRKGMSYNAAMGVIMHKLLRVMYGMLKSGKKFDSKIDAQNRIRDNRHGEQVLPPTPDERISEADEAPISGRAFKKIKEKFHPILKWIHLLFKTLREILNKKGW